MAFLHLYNINVTFQSCFHTLKLEILAVKVTLVLMTCIKHLLFFRVLCTTVPLKKLHSFSSRVHPHLFIYSMTALFSGRMTGGKWHVVIWHESNGFEACLEDMTKDLAPSAGSQLIACMTKSDLICRSVWHFKTQKVKVFNTERERERERNHTTE